MSIIQSSAVWGSALPPNLKLVALALADFADDAGICWPSLGTIARRTGYSRRQTQRIVKELRELGYVTIIREATAQTTPKYRLDRLVFEADASRVEYLEEQEREGRQIVTSALEEEDLEVVEGQMTPATRRGDTGDVGGVTPATPEPLGEPSENLHVFTSSELDETEVRLRDEFFPSEELEVLDVDEVLPAVRRVDAEYWDVVVSIFGEPQTKGDAQLAQRLIQKARAEGLAAEEIRRRSQLLTRQWGPKALTVTSLSRWWARFGSLLGELSESDVHRLDEEIERQRRRAEAARLDAEASEPAAVDGIDQAEADRRAILAGVAELDGGSA